MRRCALITTDDLEGYETDDHLLVAELERRGWRVDEPSWLRAAEWGAYELVLIRTPWDYPDDPKRFLEVLRQVECSSARLENPLELVEWNLDKSYLADLQRSGVEIVPSRWQKAADPEALDALFGELETDELVCKPNVGANAQHVTRLKRPVGRDDAVRLDAVFGTLGFFVQPFVATVVTEGEFSVFWVGGEITHAILKTPKSGDFRVQEEHGGRIRAVDLEPDLIAAAREAVEALEVEPLYARVDLVRAPVGGYWLMELELIEPSFYFRLDRQAAGRFAAAIERRLEAS